MKTLLYINFDFPPSSGPGIWRALGFVKYLPTNGWRSIVLCSDRSISRDHQDPELCEQIPSGTEIHRIRSRFETEMSDWMLRTADRTRSRLVARFLRGIQWRFVRDYPDEYFHWTSKVAARGLWLAARRRVDCVFTSGPPHIAHLAGLVIKRATGIPWIMDYRDLWTDDRWQVKRTRSRRFERIERAANQRSDIVVAVSPGYIDQLSERFAGLKPLEQYRLIRNGQDLPDDIIEQSLKLPHNRQVRIHYNGTVQQARPFELILGLLDRLPREQRPWFTFPALSPQVRDEVAARGLQQWVTELGLMSYRQGLEHCLMSDVLLNLTNRAPEYHATIPAKVYEAIALGRHLLSIGPPGSAVGPLIEECNNGTLVDGSDAEAIDHAIRRIVEQHRSGSLNADQDPVRRRALAEKYSRRQQTRELVQVLDGLVSRAPASSQYSVKASQHQAIRD